MKDQLLAISWVSKDCMAASVRRWQAGPQALHLQLHYLSEQQETPLLSLWAAEREREIDTERKQRCASSSNTRAHVWTSKEVCWEVDILFIYSIFKNEKNRIINDIFIIIIIIYLFPFCYLLNDSDNYVFFHVYLCLKCMKSRKKEGGK